MDAAKYLTERNRMCATGACYKCEFGKNTVLCRLKAVENSDPEKAIRIVDGWDKANPPQTNAQKFMEVFGVKPYKDDEGDWGCPPFVEACDDCEECKKWWDAPYTPPERKEG